jgi:hypothetical protein
MTNIFTYEIYHAEELIKARRPPWTSLIVAAFILFITSLMRDITARQQAGVSSSIENGGIDYRRAAATRIFNRAFGRAIYRTIL